MTGPLAEHESDFPQVTRAQWRERAGVKTQDEALATIEDRPAQTPLGARAARGWLRLADLPEAECAAEALASGSDGLHLTFHSGCLEALPDLSPTTPICLASHSRADEPFEQFRSRAGILYAGFDPLASLARDGSVEGGIESALARVAEAVRIGDDQQPAGRALRLDSGPWQRAGADCALDLAASITNLLEVLRAGEAAGIDAAAVSAQTVLAVDVGANLLDEIARLRALRLLVEKVLLTSGAAAPVPAWIHATTGWITLARTDPMTNALRASHQTLAAALGGADGITVRAYDALAPAPSDLGARLANNTGSILALESHLDRVADPAGGSFHLERRTAQLAHAAWNHVQKIEGRGGAAQCILDGWWRDELDAAWARRVEGLDSGQQHVLGVSLHPGEEQLERRTLTDSLAGQSQPFPIHRWAAHFEDSAP